MHKPELLIDYTILSINTMLLFKVCSYCTYTIKQFIFASDKCISVQLRKQNAELRPVSYININSTIRSFWCHLLRDLADAKTTYSICLIMRATEILQCVSIRPTNAVGSD